MNLDTLPKPEKDSDPDVSVFVDWRVLAHILGSVEKAMEIDYMEGGRLLRKWSENVGGAYFYSRPKEDFFIDEAIVLARAAGKRIVVVENLS